MRHASAIGLLVLINVLVFGQTATFDFVAFDDHRYFVNNPQFNGGLTLENIRWSFTTGYFVNWHPVTWLSLFLDNQLYGMSAGGYHVTNVIIHILASILLYFALSNMTGKRTESLIVAVLFAIHPQHVESVAWVSERKDVLCAFFMCITLLAYHKFTLTQKAGWYIAVLIAFALGLMSKPMLVTLPFVLLLLDYWPLNRLANSAAIKRVVLEKAPLLLMAVGSSFITFLVQSGGGATSSIESLPLYARLANSVHAYGMYLLRTVWPVNLTFLYPLRVSTIPYGQAALAAVVLIAVSIVIWRTHKKFPSLLVGWLWYLGTLVPVIGIVQVGPQASADRYTYIPLIGIFIALVYTIHPWLMQTEKRTRAARYAYTIILVVCLFLSFKGTSFWKNSTILAGRGILIQPDNHLAYHMLANHHFSNEDMEQAEYFYKRFYELQPNDFHVHIRLASVLKAQGKFDESEALLRTCLELYPDNAIGYLDMGLLMTARQDFEGAKTWYEQALSLPHDPLTQYHISYGNLLAQTGKLDDALKQYELAKQIDANDPSIYHNEASAYFLHEMTEEALKSIQECYELDPDYEPAQALHAAILSELNTKN